MSTSWEWQWHRECWSAFVLIDPCDFMIGLCWGSRDIVVKPLPFIVISFEWVPE